MSITSAFSLGFNNKYCTTGCKVTKQIDYYNSGSIEPYTDYGIRPSMMLSAGNLEKVKQLIDRGVESDLTRPDGSAYLLSTSDKERNVRAVFYPSIKKPFEHLLNVEHVRKNAKKMKQDIMFYFTGQKKS